MSGPLLLHRFAARCSEWAYEVAAIGLIAVYVNAFEVWQALGESLGQTTANFIPLWLAAAVGAFAIVAAIHRLAQRQPVGWWTLAVGGVLAGLAFRLADPAFPAKQAHVPEYLLMALVVHRAFRLHLSGAALVVATTVATAVLGSHDEFLQGLSPDRTFGIRDIAVNAVAGLAGALICYALEGAPRLTRIGSTAEGRLGASEWVAMGILFGGWVGLFLATYEFRAGVLPTSPLAPLLPLYFSSSR